MDERHIRVTKTARYFSLGAPGPGVQQLWVVCHGYRQLAKRFLRRFHPLDDETRLIVAPEGFSRFYLDDGTRQHGKDDPIGSSWMTREDRENEIRDYIAFLDRVLDETTRSLGGGPESLTVLGFSQGVHTVCRWVVAGDFEVDGIFRIFPIDDDAQGVPLHLRQPALVPGKDPMTIFHHDLDLGARRRIATQFQVDDLDVTLTGIQVE